MGLARCGVKDFHEHVMPILAVEILMVLVVLTNSAAFDGSFWGSDGFDGSGGWGV